MEIRSLPAGTDLYHGTSSPKDFLIPNGPAFFSDNYSVAKHFVTWHRGRNPRVLRFEATEEIPSLALIESKADFDALSEEIGFDPVMDTQGRVDLVRTAGYDGWIIPNNYPDGADIMILEPAKWLKFLDEESL